MEIVQTMNSDPGLAVGEALIFVLLENYRSLTAYFSVQLLQVISDTTSWFHPPPGKIFSVVGSLQIWLSKIHLPYLNLARNGSTFCLKTQSICFPTNYRLHGIQRSGLWGHISCQHCHRWWLCWLHIWLPGQFQLLCGHVEADGTDILAGKPLPSSSRTWNST